MTKQELLSHISQYEYVSFDLYDTLVFRTVEQPSNIWDLTEQIYNKNHKFSIHLFKERRALAEKIARKLKQEKEVCLDDIYEKIICSTRIKNELKRIEQEAELSANVPNIVMLEILNYCKQAGKQVLITTDMYLPRETIEGILHRNHITYDYLFLSNEIGYTKLSGKLFPYILSKLNIGNSKIIHTGDNQISDIQRANEAGISAVLRIDDTETKDERSTQTRNNSFAEQLDCFLDYKMISKKEDSCYEIGYTVLGPLLFELCEYVEQYRIKENIDVVSFVAREGFLLKEAYDILYNNKMSHYVRINKNVLRYPSLYLSPTVKTFLDTIPCKHEYSWRTILSYFSETDYVPDKPNMMLKRSDILDGHYTDAFEYIFQQCESAFKEQYELLLSYLSQNEIANKRVLLVNNSINGNGQYMLENVCSKAGIQTCLMGIQITKSAKCRKKLKNRVKAYFDDNKVPFYYQGMFDYCTLLFEHIMFEKSGTAVRFTKSNPVEVICEKADDEIHDQDSLGRIQEAAIDFINDYKINKISIGENAFHKFFNVFMQPTKNEAEILGNLRDKEADTIETLIDRMNWKQAEMAITGQSVKRYNEKMKFKSSVKHFLDKMGLLDFFIS